MARRKRAGENPEDDDYEGVPDGAWGGSRKPADEPTQLMEVESDPERATRLLEGLGPRLACRLTPRWLLRLLSARSTPRAAKVAALIDALHAMPAAIPDCSPARMRALDRQAVRVAATRLAAAPPAPDAPIDPDLLQAARRSLHRIDPADLADSDLPEVRELALVVGEHGLALLLWLEQVAADPDRTAQARRWVAGRLSLTDLHLQELGLSRPALEAALVTLTRHVPVVAEG